MKTHPILFKGAMVRALLDGSKTQTRRVVKLPTSPNHLGEWQATTFGGPDGGRTASGETVPLQGAIWHTRTGKQIASPYGQPGGDRLYVRETWAAPHAYDHLPPRLIPQDARIHYAATEDRGGLLWRPSIHMPRWASRITLEVTGVRVETLQDIDLADALAEGISDTGALILDSAGNEQGGPIAEYAVLWEQINGPDSWDANPWVWVVEFRRLS